MDSESIKKSGTKLSITDGVLTLVNSIFSVGTVIWTYVRHSHFFYLSIVVAIMIIVATIIYLIIKIRRQKKRIIDLTIKDCINSGQIADLTVKDELKTEQIAKLQEETRQISMLGRLINIPRFKKQRLYYTNIWRNSMLKLKNQVHLSEIHIIRKVVGEGEGLWRDNQATYIFEGKSLCALQEFKFSIAGREEVSITDINLKIIDLIDNTELHFMLFDSDDDNIKFLKIYFREKKQQGDHFKIQISWRWPKTVHLQYGYFSVPNIYSISTEKLVLEFIPLAEMDINVDIYKYGFNDTEPQHIKHVYPDKDKNYIITIENPEMNADYITDYE